MYKNILTSIVGIEIFPIISLVLFFMTFGLMLFLVFRMDKKKVQTLSNLPLEPKEDSGQ